MEVASVLPNKYDQVIRPTGEGKIEMLLVRYGVNLSVSAVLLAGCGGWQNATMGQSLTNLNVHQGAMQSPETAQDLIYASGPSESYILTFPEGKVVNSFSVSPPLSSCSNDKGQVFFPEQDKILKYAHGGTKPIATLHDTGYFSVGCAADSISGNLAITNTSGISGFGPGNVAIFTDSKGKPTFFSDPSITSYFYCTFDDQGNLFVVGGSSSNPFVLAELPRGSTTFTDITVGGDVRSAGQILWDGKYLVLGAFDNRVLYRLSVSGSNATVVSTIKLFGSGMPRANFWVQGNRVVTPTGRYNNRLGFWRYPRGGQRLYAVGPLYQNHRAIAAITVSVSTGL